MKLLARLKEEAIRLRLEQRLSIEEIKARLGVSKGSVSLWLQGYPLAPDEIRRRQSESARRATLSLLERRKRLQPKESKYHRMIAGQQITKDRKMRIAEAAVLFRLVLHGFQVYGSVFDGDKIDWLVIDQITNRAVKVQVRSVRKFRHGFPVVPLLCSNGRGKYRRLTVNEFDILVGYDLFSDTAYVYTSAELCHLKTGVTLSKTAAEKWDKLRPCGPAATTPG